MPRVLNKIIILFTLFCVGCGDFWEFSNYHLAYAPDSGVNKTLYYTLSSGGHGRISWVKRVGENSGYIFAEDIKNNYWLLEISKDNEHLNADEIVEGPYLKSAFLDVITKKGIIEKYAYPK